MLRRLWYWFFNLRDGVFWPFFGMICFSLGVISAYILMEIS